MLKHTNYMLTKFCFQVNWIILKQVQEEVAQEYVAWIEQGTHSSHSYFWLAGALVPDIMSSLLLLIG